VKKSEEMFMNVQEHKEELLGHLRRTMARMVESLQEAGRRVSVSGGFFKREWERGTDIFPSEYRVGTDKKDEVHFTVLSAGQDVRFKLVLGNGVEAYAPIPDRAVHRTFREVFDEFKSCMSNRYNELYELNNDKVRLDNLLKKYGIPDEYNATQVDKG